MLNADQLRKFIIQPTLDDLLLYSKSAEELLMFTCATESIGGTYIVQVKGPALGIFQMEPNTHNDIWQNYIMQNHKLYMMLSMNFDIKAMPHEDRLVYDLRYATAMARIHYARVPAKLPDENNVDELWLYYKRYYNTIKGAATKDESIVKYHQFLEGTRPGNLRATLK